MAMNVQYDFLHLAGDPEEMVCVAVYPVGDRYKAVIADGWCLAYGATKEKAIKAVVEKRNKELSYFQEVTHE